MTGPRRLSDGRRPIRVRSVERDDAGATTGDVEPYLPEGSGGRVLDRAPLSGPSSAASRHPSARPSESHRTDTRADLPGADVPGADVPGADVPGADVPGADVPGADVPGADVPSADVSGVDPGADAVTERHVVVRATADDPTDSPEWLLGRAGDDSGRLTVAPDAVTEAIPHGRSAQRRARRRRGLWVGIAGVLVVALVGGLIVARNVFGLFFPPDYDGPGTGRVVVEVADGASMREVGEELVRQDVVASARGFGSATEDDPNGRGIQPGYYELRHRMSAAQAVTTLLDPAARLGRADIRSGTQLDDTAGLGGATVPGVLAQISHATCLPDPSGAERCADVDDLRRTMATTDPTALGVPSWALEGVRRADPARRLEGLVAPGPYDIPPGSDARSALATVMRTSATRLEATGLVGEAERQHRSPYQVLVVASLAEKEGVAEDFGKVARVIDNRLALPMRLQFDSTINYPLDKQRLLTQPADRARPGPYNSYLNLGLPPTPIGSVSNLALSSALDPTPGPWVYFVKCQPQGESCFAVTPAEHDANRRLAQQRGAY